MRKPQRPGGVTAVAIINIVLGSLALLLSLCAGIVLIMGQELLQADPGQAAMQDFMARELPAYEVMNYGGTFILLLQGVIFLVGGIGLLNLQNWARVTTIIFAIFSILWIIIQAIYNFAFTMPVMHRFFQDMGGNFGPGPNPRAIMNITVVIQVLVWLLLTVYAIIVIVVLTRPRARDAFTGTAVEEYRQERDDKERDDRDRYDDRAQEDEDWYERRRRRTEDDERY